MSTEESVETVTVRAPGKLILLGEYAVLEGAPALVTAVDYRAMLQWRTKPAGHGFHLETSHLDHPLHFEVDRDGKPRLHGYDTQLVEKLRFFSSAFEIGWKALKERGETPLTADITLDTSEFYNGHGDKMGFGSSAALTVAILAAMLGTADRELIYNCAMDAHCSAQGRMGSGVDIAASTWGGVMGYSRSESGYTVEKLPQPPESLFIIPVWSGQSASTPRMVGSVSTFKAAEPGLYKNLMENLHRLSKNGIRAWRNGEISTFLDIYSEYGIILHQLGRMSGTPIFNDSHLQISKIVTTAGAVYKPSGAGGGDIGAALTDSKDVSEKVRRALGGAGFFLLPIRTTSVGVNNE